MCETTIDKEEINTLEMFRTILNAMPWLVFVINTDFEVVQYNTAVAKFFEVQTALNPRTGQLINCLHFIGSPDGCSSGVPCGDCVLRTAISAAFQGSPLPRQQIIIKVIKDGMMVKIKARISATPFRNLNQSWVVLVMENMEETDNLEHLIAVCATCHKVRNEHNSWLQMESYLNRKYNLDFSHTICPNCYEREMAKLKKQIESLA